MRITYRVFLALVCALAVPLASFAAAPQNATRAASATTSAAASGKTVADTPTSVTSRTVQVSVDHDGSDMVGSKLALELKGVFSANPLFILTETDAPKVKVYLSTVAEFPARPGIAAVYTVVWGFSQNEGTLSFLLGREVGVVAADEVSALASKIAERTDGYAVKYGYLFKK